MGTAATSGLFPSVQSSTAQSTLGEIQGSNYGGHAAIVGAHVFLLEGTTNGYGGKAKSLLAANETVTSASGSVFTTALDSTTGSPTKGDYYVTTDSSGYFDLSNGYTCDAGYPVYIYAQGGNPETIPAITVTSANAYSPAAGHFVYVFTTSGTNLAYQGESLNFSTFTTGTGYDGFSGGQNQTVSPYYLTTTTVGFDLGSNLLGVTPGTAVPLNATLTQATPISSNPAIVNLAVLGICPSSGTANFSSLPFVYVNEVSTAAAAYALGGFFPAPGTAGLANAGAVAANLSIPASDNLALLGLQNAAITADQIYDILGTNLGTGGDGETHIARNTTPGVAVYATTTSGSPTISVGTSIGLLTGTTITGAGIPAGTTITAINSVAVPNTLTLSANATATGSNVLLRAGAGNGTVPQTLINTVGNILANCVDSANTYNPYTATGTASTQCSSLFGYAKSAGTSGTTPVDTASAAIDIAHNPWANVSNLLNVGPGNEPFQPTLSTANDFSVGIVYTPANVNNPEGLAVDGQGRIWYPNAGSGYVTTLTPFGGVQYNVNVGGSPDYIAIDGNGNAWFDNKGNGSLQEMSYAGSFINSFQTGNLQGNEAVSVDGVNDTGYIYGGYQATPGGFEKFAGTGALTTTPQNPLTGSQSCMGGNTNAHSAVDNANNGYNLWITGEAPDVVCIVNTSTGALVPVTNPQTNPIVINSATGIGSSYQPEFPAIDASGNAWIPNQNYASISKITQAGVLTNIPAANLSGAFGAAVDGAGNIFVSNRTGNAITEFIPGSGTATPVSTNYYGGGSSTIFSDALNLQADPSGNLWITNYAGSRIVELLGVAAPTWEPLSDAANHNALGSKP